MGYSHHSSPHAGPASSPQSAGTAPTVYSPVVVRDGRQLSSKAAGKQPVRKDHTLVPQGQLMDVDPNAAWLDELDPADQSNYVSRYLGIPINGYVEKPLTLFEPMMKTYDEFYYSVPLCGSRDIKVRFDSVRDCYEARKTLTSHGFATSFITPNVYAAAKFQDSASVNEFEGQLRIVIGTQPPAESEFVEDLHELVNIVCDFTGPIRKSEFVEYLAGGRFVFRVEYFSLDAAMRLVQTLNQRPVQRRLKNTPYHWQTMACDPWTGANYSATAPITPTRDDRGQRPGFQHESSPSGSNPYSMRHQNDQHNRVSCSRIQAGLDVRTTVMLRNIPNKLDWLALKGLLDKYCFGQYDFLYLRIDFNTACNVGYAFINFTDTNGIVNMMKHIANQQWDGYRSQKNAEVSYATIQGKEALVQKFRNSMVMHETPFCRPRLFHTLLDGICLSDLKVVGKEIPFPSPDNFTKLQRSLGSARMNGIYPSNGSAFADARARTSMYDNGNPRDQTGPSDFTPRLRHLTPQMKQVVEEAFMISNLVNANGFHLVPYEHIPPQFAALVVMNIEHPIFASLGRTNPGPIGQTVATQPEPSRLLHQGQGGHYDQARISELDVALAGLKM